ncbi:EthD domain-containing protein [Niveispirillum fermenti]|uniref:EthD domain-containing protein n=1 Tax=Niveispirillum fermenti TaxID=1233113 RepID=UPI003A880763
MMKLISLLDRRPDIDLASFSHHWRTIHRELALRLVAPGIMRAYVQNHRAELDLPGLVWAGDGCPEVWVDDATAVERLRDCPEYLHGAALDEPNFMSGGARMTITTTRTVKSGPTRPALAGRVKLMLFLDDARPVPPASQDRHSVLLPDGEALRVERDILIGNWPDSLGRPCCRHVESSWWESAQSLQSAWETVGPVTVHGMVILEEAVLWQHGEVHQS